MNKDNLKPFKKGYDPRRNLRGVPPEAIKARKLIRKIASELVDLPSGEEVTRIDNLIRGMFSSRSSAEKIAVIKALWPGILVDNVEQSGSVTLKVVYDKKDERIQDNAATAAPETD